MDHGQGPKAPGRAAPTAPRGSIAKPAGRPRPCQSPFWSCSSRHRPPPASRQALAHLVAVVEDCDLVAVGSQLLGEVQPDEGVAAALGVDDQAPAGGRSEGVSAGGWCTGEEWRRRGPLTARCARTGARAPRPPGWMQPRSWACGCQRSWPSWSALGLWPKHYYSQLLDDRVKGGRFTESCRSPQSISVSLLFAGEGGGPGGHHPAHRTVLCKLREILTRAERERKQVSKAGKRGGYMLHRASVRFS